MTMTTLDKYNQLILQESLIYIYFFKSMKIGYIAMSLIHDIL